jgi:hypothetical protein
MRQESVSEAPGPPLPAFAGTSFAGASCPADAGKRVLPLCAGGIGIKLVRAISTGQLRGLPRFHLRPIDVVVFHGSSSETWF